MADMQSVDESRATQAPIRVMVIDDHAWLRSSLCLYLSTCADITVSGFEYDGSDSLMRLMGLRPDVVVMDLGVGEIERIARAIAITKLRPESRIIALLNHPDIDAERWALRAGVKRCLVKDIAVEDLVQAIREAHRDGAEARSAAAASAEVAARARGAARSDAHGAGAVVDVAAYDVCLGANTHNGSGKAGLPSDGS